MNLFVFIALLATPIVLMGLGVWCAIKHKATEIALRLTTVAIYAASLLSLWFIKDAYITFGIPSSSAMQYRVAVAFLCPLGVPILTFPLALWLTLRNDQRWTASTILLIACSTICIIDMVLLTAGNMWMLHVGWPEAFFEHVPRN